MEQLPAPTRQKPKWLHKLEQESWQAELIISGAAIFGCLQLPEIIVSAEQYCLLNYDRDTLYICYFAIIYWRILVFGLIGIFIFHFIVRALWIGMAGLNSVYAGGFRPNEMFSQRFQDKLREEYGDVDATIRQLDRIGSGIFGLGFGIAGVFFNFGVVGVLLIFLHRWLIVLGFYSTTMLLIIGGFIGTMMTISVVTMIMHSKRYQDHPLTIKYQWRITQLVSRFTYPLARRYITTSLNLVTSYSTSSKSLLLYSLGGMVIVLTGGMVTSIKDENTMFFIDQVYHRMGNDSTRLTREFANGELYQGIYYRPILLPESTIDPRGLSFWVPLPERELAFLEAGCSLLEPDSDLVGQARRAIERQRLLQCARDYLTITVNGQTVSNYVLKRAYVENAAGSQFGLTVFVPGPPLRTGDNLIGVQTKYPFDDRGNWRQTYTPFFYLGPPS